MKLSLLTILTGLVFFFLLLLMPDTGDLQLKQEFDRAKLAAFKDVHTAQKQSSTWKITQKWVADNLGRSVGFVKKWWNVDINHNTYQTDKRSGIPATTLSNQLQAQILRFCKNQRKRGTRKCAKYVNRNGTNNVSHQTIWHFLRASQLKPRHRRNVPMLSALNITHRLELADFLSNLTDDQWLNMVVMDEFFIYMQRKINSKNDVIWTDDPSECENLFYNPVPRNSVCIGVCIIMSCKTISWLIKDQGQSWDGEYFRQSVIPWVEDFMTDTDCVEDPDLACLVHDCCPGWSARATQQQMEETGIDFIKATGYGRWGGNSADLNTIENCGGSVMEAVETELMNEPVSQTQTQRQVLLKVLRRVLRRYKRNNQDYFRKLVLSFPDRLAKMVANGGKSIKY